VNEEDNGAPRHSRTIHHLPTVPQAMNREEHLAQLVTSIIDADEKAQVIAFADSRQGVERIVQSVNRPGSVLPYRSGYLAEERREIEDRLRENSIRAVIATSALELGIDMPDLNYGINLDLPPSRKQFHQRLGRVGRSQPGVFIVLAPAGRFSNYGETLKEYYQNSVEPSHLYLDNEYITFRQALCLKEEMKDAGHDSPVPPRHCGWPEGFEEALKNAHGRPPDHLEVLTRRSGQGPPQLAHSLRSAGEEELEIIPRAPGPEGRDGESIGTINMSTAMKEAYPGAVYRHRGRSYRAEEWRRWPETRQPFIRVTPVPPAGARTKPVVRRIVTIEPGDRHAAYLPETGGRQPADLGDSAAEARVLVTESVEGFEERSNSRYGNSGGGVQYYQALRERDPRKTRKQHEFPTTAVHIRINEPWFTGSAGEPWQARRQIALALRRHLAYCRSIALPDLGAGVENIIIGTPRGYCASYSSIVVYDNIYGGLGLVSHLHQNLARYANGLQTGTDQDEGGRERVSPENAERFVKWLREKGDRPGEPDEGDWWRVLRPESEVRVFSPRRNAMVEGVVRRNLWRDGILYEVAAGDELMEAADRQLTLPGSNHDWRLWQPWEDRYRELETG
jgi:DEAD/DEAH box helicase domain-containing protein